MPGTILALHLAWLEVRLEATFLVVCEGKEDDELGWGGHFAG